MLYIIIALESLLLFSHNKTSTWLDSKTPQEKERLFQAACTMTSVHRANFQKRRVEIERRRKEQQERKEKERLLKEKKAMEKKAMEEKENLTKKISRVGLWTSEAEVREGLDALARANEKKDALKLQQNLLKLLCTNDLHPCFSAEEIAADPDILLYRCIEHQFNCNGDMVWFKGTVLGYDKGTDTVLFMTMRMVSVLFHYLKILRTMKCVFYDQTFWCKLLFPPPPPSIVFVCVWEGRGVVPGVTLGFRGNYLPSSCATEVVVLSLKVSMAQETIVFIAFSLHCTICSNLYLEALRRRSFEFLVKYRDRQSSKLSLCSSSLYM